MDATPTGSASGSSTAGSPTSVLPTAPISSSASTISRSALARSITAAAAASPMRILKLPGITEIVTPTGKKQLYVIDPDEFGRYVVNHSDLTAIRSKIELLLGSPSGEVQVTLSRNLDDMKSNSLAKAEALTVVGNLLKLVASELPTIIRDILGETGVRIAPSIPANFKLFMPEVTVTTLSPARKQLSDSLLQLAPIYLKLAGTAKAGHLLKEKSADLQLKLADCEANIRFLDENSDLGSDPFSFATESWSSEDSALLYKSGTTALKKHGKDKVLSDFDDIYLSFEETGGWDGIVSALADSHDAAECRDKYLKIRFEKMKSRFTTEITETKTRMDALVLTNKEYKKEIALIDVRKSPSASSIDSKDHMLKRPVLVLNIDQLKGNPSSRALLALQKLVVNYFDQNPGSFALLRVFLIHMIKEFTLGNTLITIPTCFNEYDFTQNDASLAFLSPFIKVESQAFMQVIASTGNYLTFIEACRELQSVNKMTDFPEMIYVDPTCSMSLLKYNVFRHGGRAAVVARHLRQMLNTVSGLLANKKSVQSLRGFMKDVVLPSKKMDVKTTWEECVYPLILALKEIASNVFQDLILKYQKPTPTQKDDALPILEEILSQLIATLQENKMTDEVIFEAKKYKTQAVNFAQAHSALSEIEEFEEASINLALTVDAAGIFAVRGSTSNDVDSAASALVGMGDSGGRGRGRGRGRGTGVRNDTFDAPAKVREFYGTSPSIPQILEYAQSAPCRHHKRHHQVLQVQPFSSSNWSCQVEGCSNSCPKVLVDRYKELWTSETGVTTFWKWCPCASCFVKNIHKDLKAKSKDTMYKLGERGVETQEREIMSGKLGEAAKKQLIEIKENLVIINSNPTGLSSATNVITADTTASENAVSGGVMFTAAQAARFEELEKLASMSKKPTPWSLNC
jgi:hypothetical protein